MQNNEFLNLLNLAAEPYGFAVNESGRLVNPKGEILPLIVTKGPKGRRVQIRSCTSNNLLFSGGSTDSLSNFLERFFYAEKLAA